MRFDRTAARWRNALGQFTAPTIKYDVKVKRWRLPSGKFISEKSPVVIRRREVQKKLGSIGAQIADIGKRRMSGRTSAAVMTLIEKYGMSRPEAEARMKTFFRSLAVRVKRGKPEQIMDVSPKMPSPYNPIGAV